MLLFLAKVALVLVPVCLANPFVVTANPNASDYEAPYTPQMIGHHMIKVYNPVTCDTCDPGAECIRGLHQMHHQPNVYPCVQYLQLCDGYLDTPMLATNRTILRRKVLHMLNQFQKPYKGASDFLFNLMSQGTYLPSHHPLQFREIVKAGAHGKSVVEHEFVL
ncbi:unnamed protein product, partial [Mesorhabditis spiculigera]